MDIASELSNQDFHEYLGLNETYTSKRYNHPGNAGFKKENYSHLLQTNPRRPVIEKSDKASENSEVKRSYISKYSSIQSPTAQFVNQRTEKLDFHEDFNHNERTEQRFLTDCKYAARSTIATKNLKDGENKLDFSRRGIDNVTFESTNLCIINKVSIKKSEKLLFK